MGLIKAAPTRPGEGTSTLGTSHETERWNPTTRSTPCAVGQSGLYEEREREKKKNMTIMRKDNGSSLSKRGRRRHVCTQNG